MPKFRNIGNGAVVEVSAETAARLPSAQWEPVVPAKPEPKKKADKSAKSDD